MIYVNATLREAGQAPLNPLILAERTLQGDYLVELHGGPLDGEKTYVRDRRTPTICFPIQPPWWAKCRIATYRRDRVPRRFVFARWGV
jgi:hypothetical protein